MKLREATVADARAVARLHADSWRRHYRGAYRDDYLDGDVESDRESVWRARFDANPGNQYVVLAEDGADLVGFACAYGADDADWGTLLDNLHVRADRQGQRIGERLVEAVFAWCRAEYPGVGLYLWVLAENAGAQRFYRRLGAEDCGGEFSEPPGGGRIHGRRYAWRRVPEAGTP